MPLYLHGSLDCSCRAAAHLVTVTSWSVRDGAIRTVHELAVVVDHRLDLALTLKVADRQTSQRAVDLQTVDEHTGRDHLERGHFLDHTLVQHLVEVHGVLGLVLDLALGPLLLLARLGGRSRNGRLLRRHPVYDVVETEGAGRGHRASYCAKLGLGKYTRDVSAEL